MQIIELFEDKINKLIEKNINKFSNLDKVLEDILSGTENISNVIESNVKTIVSPEKNDMTLKTQGDNN